MAVLIRRRVADELVADQSVEGEITIGRATDNIIQLPGLLIALHHLQIKSLPALRLYAECKSAADITVNDLAGQRAAELEVGDEIRIGPHRLLVGYDPGSQQLVLEVFERNLSDLGQQSLEPTSLTEAGWRMRRPAYVLAVAVLLLMMVLPFALRWIPAPEPIRNWLPTDQLWSSGQISNAHLHLQDRCESCHERLFQRVRNESCLSCHAGITHHSHEPSVVKAAGLDQQRCASCHFEHGDAHAALPRHPGTCTDCHASPKDFAALSDSAAVGDFADAHPDFKVSVTRFEKGKASRVRELLSESVLDQSGLIFPHDLHLDARGVRGPDGKELMVCASCHQPDAGEVGFRALGFEQDCQRCHQLDVDLAGQSIRLPHGDSEVARKILDAAIQAPVPATAGQIQDVTETRGRRPGDSAPRGDQTMGVDQVDEVFERRVCAKCHQIVDDANGSPSVREVVLQQSWMTQAKFTHAPHQWVQCDTCHVAAKSNNSDHLLLPKISSCRSCHGGVDSTDKIQSTCIDCHRFHQGEALEMGSVTGKPANESSFKRGQAR